MMAKIRDDFEGTVHVHTETGPVALAAGDDIPSGVEISEEHMAAKTARGRSPKVDETKDAK